jgi:hypothetical protein
VKLRQVANGIRTSLTVVMVNSRDGYLKHHSKFIVNISAWGDRQHWIENSEEETKGFY